MSGHGWRAAATAAWLALVLVPLAWWLVTRRRVDAWRALPVPAAVLDAEHRVRFVTGPGSGPGAAEALVPTGSLPAPGQVVHGAAADGSPLAVAGFRGGALSVALPADPVRRRRDEVLGELGARLAHDLNTPLQSLHGHLDLIAHEPVSEAARASVRTCQRELARLQATATDLLTLTRVRSGTGRRVRVLAGALAEEAAAALLPLADERRARLSVEVPGERWAVDVVEDDLVRALRNLIRNALTHGLGADREVRVGVAPADGGVSFTVADDGPGLGEAELAQLCEPMVRGPHAHGPGSGIGLAVVAEVLSAHGARLRSEPAPRGARLAFTLPAAQR